MALRRKPGSCCARPGGGAKPIVVINKIDRDNATPHKVLDAVFELFVSLHATDEQLDFPSSMPAPRRLRQRTTGSRQRHDGAALRCDHQTYPAAARHAGEGFKMLVANLDYSDYLADRTRKDCLRQSQVGDPSVCIHGMGERNRPRSLHLHFEGMKRIEIPEAHAGDIIG